MENEANHDRPYRHDLHPRLPIATLALVAGASPHQAPVETAVEDSSRDTGQRGPDAGGRSAWRLTDKLNQKSMTTLSKSEIHEIIMDDPILRTAMETKENNQEGKSLVSILRSLGDKHLIVNTSGEGIVLADALNMAGITFQKLNPDTDSVGMFEQSVPAVICACGRNVGFVDPLTQEKGSKETEIGEFLRDLRLAWEVVMADHPARHDESAPSAAMLERYEAGVAAMKRLYAASFIFNG